MFGLEDKDKDKNPEDFEFDLEQEVKEKGAKDVLKTRIRERMQQIKTILRSGENEGDFNRLGTVLHGYVSLLKVSERVGQKK